jgi:hypothetical protein
MFDKKEFAFTLLATLFMTSLVVASITATKLYDVHLWGLHIALPVGTSLFALTFLVTDLVSEVYGAKRAYQLVVCGFLARILAGGFIFVAVSITPSIFFENQDAYETVLSGSWRILLAGILTYPISQSIDIFLFHFLKKRQTGKNQLWVRNTLSTFTSQTLDSIVFVLLAFAGTMPNEALMLVVIGQVLVKWIIALLDTPFVYIGRNLILGKKLLDFRG